MVTQCLFSVCPWGVYVCGMPLCVCERARERQRIGIEALQAIQLLCRENGEKEQTFTGS